MLNVKLKENAIEERSDWRETSIRGALNSVLWRSVRQTEQACTQCAHSMFTQVFPRLASYVIVNRSFIAVVSSNQIYSILFETK